MRIAAILLAVALLIAGVIVGAIDRRDDPEQTLTQLDAAIPGEVTPAGALANAETRESGVPSDQSAASASRETSPQPRSYLPPGFTQNPEMRPKIVEYLVAGGLAATDAERTADAVLVDLKECAENSFYAETKVFDEISLQTCTLNVASEYGLPIEDPAVRTTVGARSSE